jgi:hypothetical protein
MSIKQLNASYLLNEDRILLRLNTADNSEYRLWMTRRVTLFILVASQHLLAKKLEQEHSPETAKALNTFEQEAILEASKTANAGAQEYVPGSKFPLGFDPLLVMEAACSWAQKPDPEKMPQAEHASGLIPGLSLDLLLAGGAKLNLQLVDSMMRAMCLLLDQVRQQAGWGEASLIIQDGESASDDEPAPTSSRTSVH